MDEEAPISPDKEIDVARNPSSLSEQTETFSGLKKEGLHQRNENLKGDIAQKRAYFSVTRKITRRWIYFIIAIVILQFAARLFGTGFHAAEFIALITTTTATLVGFWAIVGAYLFPRKKD